MRASDLPQDPIPAESLSAPESDGIDERQPEALAPWRILLRSPLDFLLSRQLTKSITSTQVHNLRVFWQDGIWAAASDGLALTYIPLFALAYGASAGQVGMIAAIGNLLGALALFPGAQVLERVGRRKIIVFWGAGIVYRVPLLLLALLPFFGLGAGAAIPLVIALASVRMLGVNFSNPAWTALTADLVPAYMRGRYFSLRNLLMGVATLLAAPLAGWLIDAGSVRSEGGLLGYQLVFLLAFATGSVATWYFQRIHEPPPVVAPEQGARRSLGSIVRSSPALGGFIVSAFVWTLSLQIAAPYFNVYLVTRLGGSEVDVGIVTAISALAALAGQIVFGRLVDRKGSVRIFLLTGFPIVVLPMAWSFYTAPWEVAVNNIFGGFLWAGFNLANFNLLLMLTPDDQRPRAVALYQTAVFTAAVIGPLIGGYIADNIEFSLIFLVSGAGRLVAMLLFVAFGMRAALEYEGRSRVRPATSS